MKRRTIALSAGHSTNPSRDRGTVINGQVEGVLAARMREKIAMYLLKKHGIKARLDGNDTVLSQTITAFRRFLTPNCISVDLHLNSFINTSVRGVETFVKRDASAFAVRLAGNCSRRIAEITGSPLRGNFQGVAGVRSELESQHTRGLAFMRLPGEPILIELEFMSHREALNTYIQNEDAIAEALADELALAANNFSQLTLRTTTGVNIRSGAGVHFERVAPALPRGTIVEVLGHHNGWHQVRVQGSGVTGWVNSSFLN